MPVLSLTRNAAAINAAINHPAVRPFVGAPDAGPLDVAPLLGQPLNLFPFGEHGGFALIWTAPRTREVHTFIMPEGRGTWAREAAADAIALAAEHDTDCLWTQIVPEQRNVRAFAVGMGMKPTGETVESLGDPHIVYAMEVGTCQ